MNDLCSVRSIEFYDWNCEKSMCQESYSNWGFEGFWDLWQDCCLYWWGCLWCIWVCIMFLIDNVGNCSAFGCQHNYEEIQDEELLNRPLDVKLALLICAFIIPF